MWPTLHDTSHFTTDMLAKDCWGVHVVSRTLVHGAGTTCSSICADTRTGAWFFIAKRIQLAKNRLFENQLTHDSATTWKSPVCPWAARSNDLSCIIANLSSSASSSHWRIRCVRTFVFRFKSLIAAAAVVPPWCLLWRLLIAVWIISWWFEVTGKTVKACVLVMNHVEPSSAAPQNSNVPLRSTTQSLLVQALH